MAAPQNFRSAFNGFNREDVVHYIEYTNTRHENQLAQLRSELQSAQEALEQLRSDPAPEASQPDTSELDALTEKCAALEAENARLAEENAAMQVPVVSSEEIEALRAQLAEATAARDDALAQLAQSRKMAQEELEAYRRAERAERLARERVSLLYDQATGSLAEARSRIDTAAKELELLSGQTAAQLAALQEAVMQGTCVLQDAAVQLGGMCPELPEE